MQILFAGDDLRPGRSRALATISPDGPSLAWIRFEQEDTGAARPHLTAIYRCDLQSWAGAWSFGNPRKVTGPVRDAVIAWTPDSRTLLYSGPFNADFHSDIYTINLRTCQTKNLTNDATVDGNLVQNGQPTVSPDGRHFVYSRGTAPAGADLYRRDINGHNPAQLTAAPLNDNAPEYSPDGKRLVFHSNRDGDGDSDIHTMRATVEGPDTPAVNLTDSLQSKDGFPSQERAPSFSPDGHHIAFWWFGDLNSGRLTDGEIYSVRANGSRDRNLTKNNTHRPRSTEHR